METIKLPSLAIVLQVLTGEQVVSVITIIAPIFVAFVTVMGAIFAAYFSYKSAKVSKEAKEAADKSAATTVETGKKADTIIEKAVEIHTLTNSNLAKVTAANERLQAEIAGMRELITSLVKDKEVREAIASKLADKVTPPNLVPPAPASHPTVLTMKAKEDVVIEGTLEKKDESKEKP